MIGQGVHLDRGHTWGLGFCQLKMTCHEPVERCEFCQSLEWMVEDRVHGQRCVEGGRQSCS